MPVGFLTDSQTREYGCFVGDPTSDQLARHFHLDDADRIFVAMHRGDHNRLGVAIQLGSLRMLGTFLNDPRRAPASVVHFAANQLSIPSSTHLMTMYAESAGRWRHGPASASTTAIGPMLISGSRSVSIVFFMRCAGPAPTGRQLCSTARSPGC